MARGDDVRALARSIALGSVLGLAIGGAYLAGSRGLHSHDAFNHVADAGLLRAAQLRVADIGPEIGPAQIVPVQPLLPAPNVKIPNGKITVKVPSVAAPVEPVLRLAAAPATPVAALPTPAVSPSTAAKPFHLAAMQPGGADLECLTQAVFYESRGEPKAGQAAVAQVVLNRVRHPAFPKTVCGVVRQRSTFGCQFTFSCHTLAADPVGGADWRRARNVASAALNGAVMADVGEATHFQTVRAGPFAGLLKVAQIGAHAFYRFAGRNGAPGMFHRAAEPSSAVIATAAPAPPGVSAPMILTSLLTPVATPPAYHVVEPAAAVATEKAAIAATASKALVAQVTDKTTAPAAKPVEATTPILVPVPAAPLRPAPALIKPAITQS